MNHYMQTTNSTNHGNFTYCKTMSAFRTTALEILLKYITQLS